MFGEGGDAGLKLEVALFLFGWNLLFHDSHVVALELFVGLSEKEGVFEGFLYLLELLRLQRFQVVDEGVYKLGGRIEVPGQNLHNIKQFSQGILVLVVHELLDNQQKNLIFENVVFPGVVDNKCRFSLNHIGDVLFLEEVALAHGFYYLVYQLQFAFRAVFVSTKFEQVVEYLWRKFVVLFHVVFFQEGFFNY